MESRRRGAVGIAGVALGNALFALGTWLRDGVSLLVGVQVVAALLMVVLATAWWRGSHTPDADTTASRLSLPNVLFALGVVATLVGLLLVVAVLSG